MLPSFNLLKAIMTIHKYMFENWKQIEGFANYEVSDHGRIRNRTNDKMVKAYEGAGGRSHECDVAQR